MRCRENDVVSWCFGVFVAFRQRILERDGQSTSEERRYSEPLKPESKRQLKLQRALVFYLVGTLAFLYHLKLRPLSLKFYMIEKIDLRTYTCNTILVVIFSALRS